MTFAGVSWAYKDVITSAKLAQMQENIRAHDHRADGSQGIAIQRGSASISISAAAFASIAVTFPTPFSVVPLVQVSMNAAPGGSQKLVPRAFGVTTTGFTLYVYSGDQTTVTAAGLLVAWLAITP